jgi:hypothetical protein
MTLARHDQERFAVKVLIRSFESFCHTAHICTSGRFCGTQAARGSPEHVEDDDVAGVASR